MLTRPSILKSIQVWALLLLATNFVLGDSIGSVSPVTDGSRAGLFSASGWSQNVTLDLRCMVEIGRPPTNVNGEAAEGPPAGVAPKVIHRGVLNDKAIYLPKPTFRYAGNAAATFGLVNVCVIVDEAGNVISATAITGPVLARAAAVAAAREARFRPILVDGPPVKVSGMLVYRFIAPGSARAARGAELSSPVNEDSSSDGAPRSSNPVASAASPTKPVQKRARSATRNDSHRSGNSPRRPVIISDVAIRRMIAIPKPIYPAVAGVSRVSGHVQVEVLIDERGNVIEATVLKGPLLLRAAAVAAARGGKFNPASLSGVPVQMRGILDFNFSGDFAPSREVPPPGPVRRASPDPQVGPNDAATSPRDGRPQ